MNNSLLELFKQFPWVSTDTRNILPNSLFFGLKGAQFNGNAFATKALELGAAYAIIDEPEYKINDRYILVPNALHALQELAVMYRKTLTIPIIGITGTNGKTTTKELVHSVLSAQFNCFATKGNLNNHIGVPLSVLSISASHDVAIIEMGANHPGEIKELSHIACPTLGIITNIGKAHLEGFGGFEGVKKTKKELYDYIEQNNGILFINEANPLLTSIAPASIKKIFFNSNNATVHPTETLSFDYLGNTYSTNVTGAYNLENALAAITIGEYFGMSTQKIQLGLSNYTPTNNRSQVVQFNSNKIIMDAYNANPTSMLAALENFSKLQHPNKIAILGDMFELGEDSFNEHAGIVNFCKTANIQQVFFIGKDFYEHKTSPFYFYHNIDEIKEKFSTFKDAYILLKASRGMRFERLLDQK